MKLISVTDAGINRKKLEIEIDAEQFKNACDGAFRKLAPKLNIPGFRKGKAPRNVIDKMFGKEYIYEEAIRVLYPAAVNQAIDEGGLEFVDDEVDLDVVSADEEKGLVFTATITVRPEVKLPDYKGIKVTRPSDTATGEDVENELKRMRERNARTVDIDDRAAQDGDTVNFNFEGFVDGEPFEGGKAEGFDLTLGSGSFIPGFEDQIVGKSIGEDFDVNVTFPEDYQAENLAGKPAVFKCKINAIKAKEYFDIDDEFAKDFGDCDTLDELRDKLREQITEAKKQNADNAMDNQIAEFLADEMECIIPDAMIENRIDVEMRDIEGRLQQQGLSLKDYLRYTGLNVDGLRDQMRAKCEKDVRMRLAFEAVAKAEKIEIPEEESEARIKDLADRYSMEVEKLRGILNMDALIDDMKVEKAIDLVRAAAEIVKGE